MLRSCVYVPQIWYYILYHLMCGPLEVMHVRILTNDEFEYFVDYILGDSFDIRQSIHT